MQIDEKPHLSGVMVLDLSGNMTSLHCEGILEPKIREVMKRGYVRVVINMEHVLIADAVGLAQLCVAHLVARTLKGGIRLSNVSQRIKDLLARCPLANVFDIFTNQEEAILSFQS